MSLQPATSSVSFEKRREEIGEKRWELKRRQVEFREEEWRGKKWRRRME